MADLIDRGSRWGTQQIDTGYQQQEDGTYAEIFALANGGRLGVVVHNIATDGSVFPVDSQTDYDYDSSGVNIVALTRTTPAGISYKQTWVRNEMGQLQMKSGWVRQ